MCLSIFVQHVFNGFVSCLSLSSTTGGPLDVSGDGSMFSNLARSLGYNFDVDVIQKCLFHHFEKADGLAVRLPSQCGTGGQTGGCAAARTDMRPERE